MIVMNSITDSMRKKRTAFLLLACTLVLTGCYVNRQAVYVSPFNGNSNTYHTLPLRADSLASALFVNAAYASGSVNYTQGTDKLSNNAPGSDYVHSFQLSVYRTHNLGSFELYYGLTGSLGNYTLNKFDSLGNDPSVNYQLINQNAGKKFFGGYGASGGLDLVIPFSDGGEWRVIGFETTFTHEFGDYLQFRKQFPDSAATYIARSNFYGTIGGFTEFIWGRYSHFGIRLEKGAVMGSAYNNLQILDASSGATLKYHYFSLTFSEMMERWTLYFQVNTATKAGFLQGGINFRVTEKKKMHQLISP
jgi:hypothetical protein